MQFWVRNTMYFAIIPQIRFAYGFLFAGVGGPPKNAIQNEVRFYDVFDILDMAYYVKIGIEHISTEERPYCDTKDRYIVPPARPILC